MKALRLMVCIAVAFGSASWTRNEPTSDEWAAVKSGVSVALRSVCFGDKSHGWAVGDKGTILASADGGLTWKAQKSDSDGTLRGVHFLDKANGWVVGDGDSAAPAPMGHVLMGRPMKSGTCLATTDGGRTWARNWVQTNFDLRFIRMASPRTGQICNHGGSEHADGDTIVSGDGGKKWGMKRVFRGLNACFWIDEKTGWAVGSPVAVGFLPTPTDALYTHREARIVSTVDGGATWKPQDSPKTGELRGVWFTGKEHGVAVGDGGAIQVTTDGGATWVNSGVEEKTNLFGVAFADKERGWAVGDQGTVLETRDGGKTWKRVDVETKQPLYAIHVADKGKVAAIVGAEGTILRLK